MRWVALVRDRALRLVGVDRHQITRYCVRLVRSTRLKIMRASREQSGAVTAEFAITLPIIVLVLGFVLSAVVLSARQIGYTAAAFELARFEARGDSAQAARVIAGLPEGTVVSRKISAGTLCVTLSGAQGKGLMRVLRGRGEGCAVVVDYDLEDQR